MHLSILDKFMRKKSIYLLVLLLGISVLVTGCGKSASEKAAEKSLEASMGANADVNIQGGDVDIKTDDGVWSAGENISLPESWPDDVYVTEGNILAATSNNLGNSLTIVSEKSVADLKKEYQEKISENGWEINMSFDTDGNVLYGAEKDDRSLSVTISTDEEGQTTVMIIESQKQ